MVREAPPGVFSLTRGGPIYALERRVRLAPTDPTRAARLALVLAAIAWIPPMAFALFERALGKPWDPLILGARMHARLLVALPLLVVAEVSLESRCAAVLRHLLDHDILPPSSRARFRAFIARIERGRDSIVPELVLVLAVYALTAASVAELIPDRVLRWTLTAGHRIGMGPRYTPASLWYMLVAEPIFAILLFRWVLRWGLWAFILARLPALEARTEPAHADRAGGLAFLGSPLYSARFVWFSLAVALSGVWFDEVALRGVLPEAFAADLVFFLFLALGLGMLPYLSLTPHLVRAKREGLLAYSALVRRYIERFDGRWLETGGGDPLKESENFSGLTDIGTSFDVVVQMRATIFDFGELRSQVIVSLLPFVPIVVVFSGSVADLVKRIVEHLI